MAGKQLVDYMGNPGFSPSYTILGELLERFKFEFGLRIRFGFLGSPNYSTDQ